VSHNSIMAQAEALKAEGETAPRLARDPVNQPQVHTWLEAIGDPNPVYRDTPQADEITGGPVAPPAMAQVWTMYGLGLPGEDPLASRAGDPLHRMMSVLDEAGYTSVLGTNCDQTYGRHLRPGEHVSVTTALESVTGPKRTGVGEGYFVTSRSVWRVGDEQVATMLFRVLKFTPRSSTGDADLTDPSRTVRPTINRDNAFFFEGTGRRVLRIQRCEGCGTLRHPPGPVCPSCLAMERGWVAAAGLGRLYSFTEHHAPQIPGKRLPLLIGVVELDEGVRMIGELRGIVREDVEIGMPVQVGFDRIDDELTLAYWEPVSAEGEGLEPGDRAASDHPGDRAASLRAPVEIPGLDELDRRDGEDPGDRAASDELDIWAGQQLPGWELPLTRTRVVSTALATRDFQDVHHDPTLAVSRGTRDIFLNILTTTGLVQRYVGEWAGPRARVTSCALRLGAPAYPGDTLAFTGAVTSEELVNGRRLITVDVQGAVSLGAHVTASVSLDRGERS
jgi:uncharacterized protein